MGGTDCRMLLRGILAAHVGVYTEAALERGLKTRFSAAIIPEFSMELSNVRYVGLGCEINYP